MGEIIFKPGGWGGGVLENRKDPEIINTGMFPTISFQSGNDKKKIAKSGMLVRK